MRWTSWRGRADPGSRRILAVLIGLAALLLISGGLAGLRAWVSRPTPLEQALELAPSNALRWSWTDWAGIRSEEHLTLSATSSPAQVHRLIDKGYDADLTQTSALTASAGLLQKHYGWSPATLDWELYSQARDGALMIGHLPDQVSFDGLRDDLKTMGFQPPKGGGDVWDGTTAAYSLTSPGTDDEVSAEITHVALVPDRHLVLTSDGGRYLQRQVDALGHRTAPAESVLQVAEAADRPLSAYVNSGDYACSKLSMSSADETDQAQADELISSAGQVNPLDAMAMAREPGGDVRVTLAFENHDQATENADARAKLASGPAPGQGGEFGDRFRLGRVTADGNVVTMALHPRPDASVMSDLGNGPVLFLTC